jgi:hypothetical protein
MRNAKYPVKKCCVFINHAVFVNALCDVFEIVLVLQSCGTVLKWWLGTVQLAMSSITVNLDPEFYYTYIRIRMALIIFIQLCGPLEMHEKNSGLVSAASFIATNYSVCTG